LLKKHKVKHYFVLQKDVVR